MASSYYSLVPRSQKPYATPWYQQTYTDTPLSIEEELENAITQIISENDVSNVPSADAIYKYLYQRLLNIVTADQSNTFTNSNVFNAPIINETEIDFTLPDNLNLLPNVKSVKEYVSDLISGEIPDLANYVNSLINAAVLNSYTYISSTPMTNHIIPHNMNSSYIIYNLLIFDPDTGNYKNGVGSVIELDSNTLVVELDMPQIIKVIITRVISGSDNTFTYTSSTESVYHMLNHNLHSNFIYFNIMVYNNESGYYKNDIVSITEIDSENLLIETNIPVNIKAAIAVI